jgi:hypothetical protein
MKAPPRVIFPPLPVTSLISAPNSLTPSGYLHPLMSEIKSHSPPHTHIHTTMGKIIVLHECLPMSVAARSKEYVCGRSLAGIAGSNPVGGTDVRLL